MPGVTATTVGYTGGKASNPSYESVCAGDGHTEALQVQYDPEKVTYDELLKVFHKGCHGDSRGKVQYKSAVWYHTPEQKKAAEKSAQSLGRRNLDIQPAQTWHDAEQYHQKYYKKNGCVCQ